ncbi:MAG TPA: CopD family protein, partial [Micromonospora sp.]
ELGAILPIWAGWAAASVSALVIAGATQGLIEVGGVKALFTTTYGRLLIAKLVLFGSVILTAAYSRYLVNSGTAPVRPSLLRRAVLVEIGVTAAVLAISSVLVQTTPARTAEAQPADTTNGVFSTTLTSPLYSLQVTVDPAKVGNNSVHLVALTPDNKPLPVVEWQASAGLPAQGIEPIDIPLLPLTDDHATGEINLPAAGDWQLRFTLRLSDIDQATVTATVPIT